MAHAVRPTWKRFAVTTLLWSLALLLLSNVVWSVWSAWQWRRTGFQAFAGSPLEVTGVTTRKRDGAHVRVDATTYEIMTRSACFVHVLSLTDRGVLYWRSQVGPSLAEVAPAWVQQQVEMSLSRSWDRIQHERPGGGGAVAQFYLSSGWPCRLLWSGVENSGLPESPRVISGIPVPIGDAELDGRIVCLPVRPIWTGQLLTAAMWFGVVVAVRMPMCLMMSHLRNRRGLCTQCAYNLRGNTSGVCPECGANVADKAISRGGAEGAEEVAS